MSNIAELYEALDNMDDYALMANIKPVGPHAVLTKGIQRLEAAEKLIEQLESALSGVMRFTIDGTVECRGDKCRERWCLSCNTEEDANEAVAEAYNSFAVVNEALAAAKQWKDGV